MSRIGSAFSAFFRVLFGRSEASGAAPALPASAAASATAVAMDAPVRAAPARHTLHEEGALAALALLQRDGRLLDFVNDSLDGASDAEVAAAAREVHRGCQKVVRQLITVERVMLGDEGARITVPRGFDAAAVRLSGRATSDAPSGILRHHGWRAAAVQLPTLSEGVDRRILHPAEVDVA